MSEGRGRGMDENRGRCIAGVGSKELSWEEGRGGVNEREARKVIN